MAYDDQRGRTGSFQQGLRLSTGQGGGGTNWGVPMVPSFLGGNEAGGFLSGGPAGGFTNFSQYLMANPGGAGEADPNAATTPGQSGMDAAMNTAYGVHNYTPPPPPPGGGGPAGNPPPVGTGPNGGPAGPGPGGPTGGGGPVGGGPGWGSGWTPGSGMLPGTGSGAPPPPPPPPSPAPPGDNDPFSKRLLR